MNTLAAMLAWPVLIGSAAAVLWMAVSLARRGDERRELILAKAGEGTLAVVLVVLAVCAARNWLEGTLAGASAWRLDPWTMLAGTALVFACQLFFWKRRYGG